MTDIPRAPLRPAPIGPWRRALARVGAVVASVALAGAGALPAHGATDPTPTPTPSDPLDTGVLEMVLAPVGGGIVTPGMTVALSIVVRNGTNLTAPAATAEVEFGSTPLRDRAALDDWLTEGTGVSRMRPAGSTSVDAVEPTSQTTTGVSIAADAPVLDDLAPGVYPVSATYSGAEGTLTSTTAVVVPDPAITDATVAVIVPLTVAARTEAVLSAAELDELTGPGGSLTRQLDGVSSTDAILAIDPAIVASIRLLGARAPESATAWLAALDALPNPRFALQYGDADVAVQLEAGRTRPLQPSSFVAYLDDFSAPVPEPEPEPTETPGATPTPTPTEEEADAATDGDATEAAAVPTTDELVAVTGARSEVYWPAGGEATGDVVDTLGALGADDAPSLTLLTSAATDRGSRSRTVSAHATAGDAGLLVYDSAISAALQSASLEDTAARGASLAAATAHLAFAVADADGRPVAVALDRDQDRSSVALRSTITAATALPGVSPVSLAQVESSPSVSVSITGETEGAARVAAASALFDDEGDLARFATVLDTPALLTGPERLEILQLLDVAWIGDPTWPAVLAEHRTSTATTIDSVGLQETPAMNLYGTSAGLRFWVRNDLPYPVNLVLYTTPDNLRLDVQRATDVVATAESNTRVEVPVQARLGNGEVTLTLQLRSPASVAIGESLEVDVNVQAEWEAIGIWVLAVLIGGLLVLGAVRTVRRARRPRDESGSAGTGDTQHDPEHDAAHHLEHDVDHDAEHDPEERS